MIVLDTNVLSELMRASPAPAVISWLGQQPALELCTTAVSVAEIRYGLARLPRGRRRSQLSKGADEVFQAFADQVLPFDAEAARDYADIVIERDRAGLPISGFDAQIAAICRSQGARLATRNTADFAALGLDLTDPFQS